MIYWLKALPKVGFKCWLLLHHMIWKCGCFSRPLVLERSWKLYVEPSPLPEFYAWECEAGWYVGVGWFRLFVARASGSKRQRTTR